MRKLVNPPTYCRTGCNILSAVYPPTPQHPLLSLPIRLVALMSMTVRGRMDMRLCSLMRVATDSCTVRFFLPSIQAATLAALHALPRLTEARGQGS